MRLPDPYLLVLPASAAIGAAFWYALMRIVFPFIHWNWS